MPKFDISEVVAAAAAAAAGSTMQDMIAQSQAAMPQAISDLQPTPDEAAAMLAMLPQGINLGNVKIVHIGYEPAVVTVAADGTRTASEKPIFAVLAGIPVGLVYDYDDEL